MEVAEAKSRKALTFLLSVLIVGVAIAIAVFVHFYGNTNDYSSTSNLMGMRLKVNVFGENAKENLARALAAAENTAQKIDPGNTSSEISKLNVASKNECTELSGETFAILQKAQELYDATDGMFDMTVAPMVKLWNFAGREHTVPPDSEIQLVLKKVGNEFLQLDPENGCARITKEGVGVGTGSAQNGAVCDAVVKSLANAKADSGVVNFGGTTGVYGTKTDKQPWQIPIKISNEVSSRTPSKLGILNIKKGFLSTCSVYDTAFMKDGKLYHFLLNPKTGYPAKTKIVAACVYHGESAALSDMLTFGCILVGDVEPAKQLLAKFGAEAVLVGEDNKVYVSDGLKEDFVLTRKNYEL